MNALFRGKEIQARIAHLLANSLLRMSASTQLTVWLGTEEHACSPRHFPGIFAFQVPLRRVKNVNQFQSWHTDSSFKETLQISRAQLYNRNESVLGIRMSSNDETLRRATLGLR